AALELMGYNTALNGGVPGGIQVRESLVLNGAGNFTTADTTHGFTSPVRIETLTNVSDDNLVDSPITLQTDVGIDVGANSRLSLWKTISGPGGFTKDSAGKLVLGGTNTYAGNTLINAGIVNLQSGGALGAPTGGTIVSANAQLELQGDITIAGEHLTLTGNGPDAAPTLPLRWFPMGPGGMTDASVAGNNATGRVTGTAVD